jgi:hypothetical protein
MTDQAAKNLTDFLYNFTTRELNHLSPDGLAQMEQANEQNT